MAMVSQPHLAGGCQHVLPALPVAWAQAAQGWLHAAVHSTGGARSAAEHSTARQPTSAASLCTRASRRGYTALMASSSQRMPSYSLCRAMQGAGRRPVGASLCVLHVFCTLFWVLGSGLCEFWGRPGRMCTPLCPVGGGQGARGRV